MLLNTILLTSALAAIATAQNASTNAVIVRGNPVGASYDAVVLPNKSNITGNVLVTSSSDGQGSRLSVKFDGLPCSGGPFMWHIHKSSVVDGNCTTASTHLDPYGRGEVTPCDASDPISCEVGDQSGKWGKFGYNGSTSYSASYLDLYVATLASDPAYVGGKSIVVHYPNKTRIACANFVQVSAGQPPPPPPPAAPPVRNASTPSSATTSTISRTAATSSYGGGGGVSTTAAPVTSAPPVFTGGAAVAGAAAQGALALVVGGLAFAF